MHFKFDKPEGEFIRIKTLGYVVINCIYMIYVLPMLILFLFGAILSFGTLEIGGE